MMKKIFAIVLTLALVFSLGAVSAFAADISAASWKTAGADDNKITIANHSNAAVTATLTYEQATGFEGINGTFDNDVLPSETAVGRASTNPDTKTATLTLTGALNSNTAANTKIGTVKVTLG